MKIASVVSAILVSLWLLGCGQPDPVKTMKTPHTFVEFVTHAWMTTSG